MTIEIQEPLQGRVKPLSFFQECEYRRKRLINFFKENENKWIGVPTIITIQELRDIPKRTLRNDLHFLTSKEHIQVRLSLNDARQVLYKWKGKGEK